MRYQIHHQTRYRFRRPVTLLPHRMLVTPRDGAELKLLDMAIDCGPDAVLTQTDDVFANRVVTASFPTLRTELLIDIATTVEQTAPPYPIFTIDPDAHRYPFRYSDDDRIDLGALRDADGDDPDDRVRPWVEGFVAGPGTDTLALLQDINAGLVPAIAYRVRDEEGTQSPAETLGLASGSCRDIAALFIAGVRALGFGARAVSGYLFDADIPAGDAGSTHAWAEVYLPGAGWISFDPTHRRMGDAHLIAVAVGRHNRQIMPVTGGYLGAPDDAVDMDVTVEVRALD